MILESPNRILRTLKDIKEYLKGEIRRDNEGTYENLRRSNQGRSE